MASIGIIGAGHMGSALSKGLSSGARQIMLYDAQPGKAEQAAHACGGRSVDSSRQLFEQSDTVVIAVKPQQLEALFDEVGGFSKDSRVISIAAGIPISLFRRRLSTAQVVRFMPNLAATVSASVVGVAVSPEVDDAFRREALSIAEALGTAVQLPEAQLSSITGLSGSGIAYVFAFLHALALGGTQAGIPYETSLEIAEQTVDGALQVLKHGNAGPSEMLTKVASAGGTTIEGIRALEERGFTAAVMDAVLKAARRASEIERESMSTGEEG